VRGHLTSIDSLVDGFVEYAYGARGQLEEADYARLRMNDR
jgi:hypothetical protein